MQIYVTQLTPALRHSRSSLRHDEAGKQRISQTLENWRRIACFLE